MAIDMAQFHEMFFDECEEFLDRAGQAMGAGDSADGDHVDLEALYRCVHSIKGGSETFGFVPIAQLARALEALLAEVRAGDLAMDTRIRRSTAEGLAAIRAQLAACRRGDVPDETSVHPLLARLDGLRTKGGRNGISTSVDAPGRRVDVLFRISRMIVGSELMMDFVLEELGGLGQVLETRRPEEGSRDGQWQVTILTNARDEVLRGVFDRVAEPGTLRVELAGSATDPPVDAVQPPPVRPALLASSESGSGADTVTSGDVEEAETTLRAAEGAYLSFLLGRQAYAVDASRVRKLRACGRVSRIDACPDFIPGVVDYEGGWIPVLDLRRYLGSGIPEITEWTTQVIVDSERATVSMLVDSVEDLIHLSGAQIRPLPELPLPARAPVAGLASRGDDALMLLDLDILLQAVSSVPVAASGGSQADA